MLTLEDYSLLESRPPIFLFSPTVSFSLKASTEQLGRGSCGPGVGPGRLLKYLIFKAWTMTDKKLSPIVTVTWDEHFFGNHAVNIKNCRSCQNAKRKHTFSLHNLESEIEQIVS